MFPLPFPTHTHPCQGAYHENGNDNDDDGGWDEEERRGEELRVKEANDIEEVQGG